MKMWEWDNSRFKSERGQALMVVLMVVFVMMILGAAVVASVVQDVRNLRAQREYDKAYVAADSIIRRVAEGDSALSFDQNGNLEESVGDELVKCTEEYPPEVEVTLSAGETFQITLTSGTVHIDNWNSSGNTGLSLLLVAESGGEFVHDRVAVAPYSSGNVSPNGQYQGFQSPANPGASFVRAINGTRITVNAGALGGTPRVLRMRVLWGSATMTVSGGGVPAQQRVITCTGYSMLEGGDPISGISPAPQLKTILPIDASSGGGFVSEGLFDYGLFVAEGGVSK